MIKDKKILFAIIGVAVVLIISAIAFVFSKTKSKEMVQIINKIYYAYSSYVLDLGHSPANIAELYSNQNNVAKWNGPYVSKTSLEDYDENTLQIIQASSIPTKNCSLDNLNYCYKWIKVSGLSNNDFKKIKESLNLKANVFFAENNMYFKLSSVE